MAYMLFNSPVFRLLKPILSPNSNVILMPSHVFLRGGEPRDRYKHSAIVYFMQRQSQAIQGRMKRSNNSRKHKRFLHAAYVTVKVMKDKTQVEAQLGSISPRIR